MFRLAAQCALLRDGPFPASRFFSAVRRCRARVPRARRVRRFVPASAGRCILRARLRLERVRWELVRLFRLPAQRGPEAALVGLRGGLVNVTFHAA